MLTLCPTTAHLQLTINSFTRDLIQCLTSLMYIQLAPDCHQDHQHFCLPTFNYLLKDEKKTFRSALKGGERKVEGTNHRVAIPFYHPFHRASAIQVLITTHWKKTKNFPGWNGWHFNWKQEDVHKCVSVDFMMPGGQYYWIIELLSCALMRSKTQEAAKQTYKLKMSILTSKGSQNESLHCPRTHPVSKNPFIAILD